MRERDNIDSYRAQNGNAYDVINDVDEIAASSRVIFISVSGCTDTQLVLETWLLLIQFARNSGLFKRSGLYQKFYWYSSEVNMVAYSHFR
jgi:hypothetical protein